ncbi:hypothetical protein JCM10213v2_006477 [Rhodosporidiobolus nylandii]
MSDQVLGCASQCIFENKVKKGNREYFTNIALKINHKLLQGANSALRPEDLGPIAERPTLIPQMCIGADVSHANPGSMAPSVAALVGSMDDRATLYSTAISIQTSRLEIMSKLEEMVVKLLDKFLEKNCIPPERILFFRDGISEGQFGQVMQTEVFACRLAAKRFAAKHGKENYNPELTFICCGKRHHLSFFPKSAQDADARTGNTCIDTTITSPFHFDWYQQAHASLLGTGRSAHYTVLVDDAGFTADQLQQLVFNLCFTYARATRAVSVVTPAFYASRLCTRAQLLLKREDDDSTTVVSSASGSSGERIREAALAEYNARLKDIHPAQDTRLFWM